MAMKMASKAKILVVDDDQITLKVVCQMLVSLGYETIAATDGIEALSRMSGDDGFDFVLTDINMPHIDGWQLADRIKALKPGLPIIALTGENPESILPRLQDSAMDHALFKPLKIGHLKDAISDILAKRESQSSL
jgi:CheY-like chemotaxis protein